jgi:UDPglucose--hexose-1-phosphate uridylyltransferase
MPGERCEVVLYTSEHDATFFSLGLVGARKVVDLWADRTTALGSRDDVDYVLVFENRGPEVGATIAHPHGQIYAYDHVPQRQSRRLAGGWAPDKKPGDRLVIDADGWRVWVPYAPTFPVALNVAPNERRPDLPSLSSDERDSFAATLVDVFSRLDLRRSAGVPRFIAAAELASEEFFNPVIPEDVAARLRELG